MTHSTEFIRRLAELDQAGRPVVVVTLVDAVGSTPQDVGSKILVNADGLVSGTIGGGRLEQQAIEMARQMLTQSPKSRSAMLVEWNLQQDVGMTCGGAVKLFFEGFNLLRWRIVIFGAGHVAQALTRCLLNLDCQILCIDSRPEWLAQLPESPRLSVLQLEEVPQAVDQLAEDDFVVCMTMGHRSDGPILQRIFQQARSVAFLGVIGSQAKRKALVRELQEAGIPPEQAEQFECPIGLPLGNNQPQEIAISITAQLLQRRDQRWAD
jgi:xanthine dehydrogenase accessory factor